MALPSELRLLLEDVLRPPSRPLFPNSLPFSTESTSGSSERRERFKALIDSILFSQRFILTYQLVLAALLLIFTATHWTSRFRAWRKRRIRRTRAIIHGEAWNPEEPFIGKGGTFEVSASSSSSSSSSTIRGDLTPKTTASGKPNETTSLLSKQGTIRIVHSRYHALQIFRGWLAYQPRPIPFINKTLPSNGASLAIMAFLGLQIFYTFYKTPLSVTMLFAFANRTSMVFVANLPLLYLFAAKNQPLKILTGYSYESLNILHRRLGEVLCLLALLHSAGMVGVWYTVLRPSGETFIHFLLIKMILLGSGAFIAYELIYFTSLGSFRQRWYELFLGLHVFLQATALILVWFHHSRSRLYIGTALAIFLIDRIIYRMIVKSSTLLASIEVKDDRKTVSVRVPLLTSTKRGLWNYLTGSSNITRGWKATEHVFLTIPSLAHKHIIQAHPFTIASKAPGPGSESTQLELLIRGQDGFSGDLVHYADHHRTVAIRLDGPYGSQSAVRMLQDSDHAIIISGGSGIAVGWPLVCAVLDTFIRHDLEQPTDLVNPRRILFIWVVREQSHVLWLDQGKLAGLAARGVTVTIPPPTSQYGHPDLSELITDWTVSVSGQIGVVASGPDGLNRTVRNACASLIRQGVDVNVEIEKFGW